MSRIEKTASETDSSFFSSLFTSATSSTILSRISVNATSSFSKVVIKGRRSSWVAPGSTNCSLVLEDWFTGGVLYTRLSTNRFTEKSTSLNRSNDVAIKNCNLNNYRSDMTFDRVTSLFFANSAVNFISSQLLLANPSLVLNSISIRVSRVGVGLARYRGVLHAAYTILSIQAMVSNSQREKRVASLALALTSAAQCCLDWALFWSGVYWVLPVAVIDGSLAVANAAFFLTEKPQR
jgi:hypothetical protein